MACAVVSGLLMALENDGVVRYDPFVIGRESQHFINRGVKEIFVRS
jgi:hypothetical protein